MITRQKAYKDIVTDKIQLESYYRPLLKHSALWVLNQKIEPIHLLKRELMNNLLTLAKLPHAQVD